MEATAKRVPGLTWFGNLTSRVIIAGCLTALAAGGGLAGCASAGKRPGPVQSHPTAISNPTGPDLSKPAEVMGPQEPFGPPPPVSPDQPTTTYGPEPISIRPVVLVLGPGMARGFAYVGAIRALDQAKIPVGAVLGTEMGAFVGSLYAMSGRINQFEWALLKFHDDVFTGGSSLLPSMFQRAGRTKKLDAELSRVFERKDLNQSKLPLRIAVQAKGSGSATVLDRGPAVAAVRGALADSEFYEPASLDGAVIQSASRTRPFLITEARALGLGPVVVIDALDEKEERATVSVSELKDADLVVRPDLKGIGAKDFQKRTDAAFRGKKAVEDQLAEIKHLVGMSREGEPQKGTAQ